MERGRLGRLLKDQNEDLEKSARELDDLAQDALRADPPMLTSAAGFQETAREARNTIRENLEQIGELRQQIVKIDAELRRLGR